MLEWTDRVATMTLQPLLKAKVDELFLLWLSEPETQELLRSNMNQMLRGEPITRPASQLIANRTTGGINRQPKSPRGRTMTPGSAPPYSPANGVSPRSPRPKNVTSKNRSLPVSSLVCHCFIDEQFTCAFFFSHWSVVSVRSTVLLTIVLC